LLAEGLKPAIHVKGRLNFKDLKRILSLDGTQEPRVLGETWLP
jgi:hypothetical protein